MGLTVQVTLRVSVRQRIPPAPDWGSSGRRFKSCQPDNEQSCSTYGTTDPASGSWALRTPYAQALPDKRSG